MWGAEPRSLEALQSSQGPRAYPSNTSASIVYKGSLGKRVLSAESIERIRREWKWPVKGGSAWRRQLILLYMANSYPYPVSVGDLRDFMEAYGVGMTDYALKKAIHYLYYYYHSIKRTSRGMYVLEEWYLDGLDYYFPWWRELYRCILEYNSINKDTIDNCKNKIINKDTKRYHWIPLDTIINRSVDNGIFLKQNKEEEKEKQCNISISIIEEKLKEDHSIFYEELKSQGLLRDALEIIHVFIEKHRKGKPYIKVLGSRDTRQQFYIKLLDEAKRLVGGSSSLYQKLDPDDIAETVRLLVNNDILFYRRYGSEHKWRIDKAFLREVGCI